MNTNIRRDRTDSGKRFFIFFIHHFSNAFHNYLGCTFKLLIELYL